MLWAAPQCWLLSAHHSPGHWFPGLQVRHQDGKVSQADEANGPSPGSCSRRLLPSGPEEPEAPAADEAALRMSELRMTGTSGTGHLESGLPPGHHPLAVVWSALPMPPPQSTALGAPALPWSGTSGSHFPSQEREGGQRGPQCPGSSANWLFPSCGHQPSWQNRALPRSSAGAERGKLTS